MKNALSVLQIRKLEMALLLLCSRLGNQKPYMFVPIHEAS